MATGRDDFVIAFRSAFLKKSYQQKFSLLTLIFLSFIIIILSSFNFKAIQFIKMSINEVVYRSSFIVSIPENNFKDLNIKIKEHLNFYDQFKIIKNIFTKSGNSFNYPLFNLGAFFSRFNSKCFSFIFFILCN